MKFYLVNGNFTNRPDGAAFKDALDAHHAYWAQFIQTGKVLLCGPKTTGCGILIVKCDADDSIDAMIAGDPFVERGIASFEASEFKAFYKMPAIADWFE